MVFDGSATTTSCWSRPELRDRVIFVDSLSKTYGMPGWRVGFVGRTGIDGATRSSRLNSNHITNLPEMVHAAGVAALTGPQDIPLQKCAEFASKRDQVMAVMNAIPGVVCPRPQGAFYAFPDISCAFGKTHQPSGRTIENDVDFCNASCWRPRASPACRARRSASRVRCASATPVRRRNSQQGLDRVREFFAELT